MKKKIKMMMMPWLVSHADAACSNALPMSSYKECVQNLGTFERGWVGVGMCTIMIRKEKMRRKKMMMMLVKTMRREETNKKREVEGGEEKNKKRVVEEEKKKPQGTFLSFLVAGLTFLTKDRSAYTTVRAATLRQELPAKFAISLSHRNGVIQHDLNRDLWVSGRGPEPLSSRGGHDKRSSRSDDVFGLIWFGIAFLR